MAIKKLQAQIELIPKTDKMDAYLKKMNTVSVGTGAGAGGGNGEEMGKGILTSLSTLLGEGTITGISSALSGMISSFITAITEALGTGVAAIVGAIIFLGGLILGFLAGLGINALMKFLSGINIAMETVGTVLEVIGKMIGMIMMPFVNLLIPLLIPLLYILAPFIKLLNMIMMPLMMIMMKVFGQFGANVAQLIMKFFAGEIDLPALIGGLFTEIATLVKSMETIINDFRDKYMAVLIDFVNQFLTLDLSTMRETLVDLLGEKLGNAVGDFIDMLYYAISALGGFVVGLVGEDVAKGFGIDVDKIKKVNKGFVEGEGMGVALRTFIDSVLDISGKLIAFGLAQIDPLIELVNGLIDVVIPVFQKAFLSLSFFIIDTVLPAFNSFMDWWNDKEDGTPGAFGKMSKIVNFMTKKFNDFMDWWNTDLLVKAQMLADAFGKVALAITKINWESVITSVIRAFLEGITGSGNTEESQGGGGFGARGDFIMKPNGQVLSFSPNDTIMGFQNPNSGLGGALSGGSNSSQVINITINGDVSGQELINKIKTELEKISRNDLSRRGVGVGVF